METTSEKLDSFFGQVKTLTFWRRIFHWAQFRTLSYDAYQEFKALLSKIAQLMQDLEKVTHEAALLKKDNDHLLQNEKTQGAELTALRARAERLTEENSSLRTQNTAFQQTEETRRRDYETRVATLNSIQQQIQADRKEEIEERQRSEMAALISLKGTWSKHQTHVQEAIKGICSKHTIGYVENVPFKGTPDNTIKISDEFVVFDAKSPGGDNLDNFFAYIKTQTEQVKKYAKEENVRKDIFLVIPSNTVHVISQFVFNMADYNVYVVTPDSLEPIFLSLKRIEDYEFVDQLSPEERENICRVIGKFAHMTKRRIQIDHFFSRQFLEILLKCDADLPPDILEKVGEYERSEKLNPPQEKRAKIISGTALEADGKLIRREAEAKGIVFPQSIQQDIKALPLYGDGKLEPNG